MQAVIFEQPGRPEDVLTVRDIPVPAPGRDQALIRVAARPIQPADFMFIEGRYRVRPSLPQVAGFDGVGAVVACGPGVTDLEPGMRVAFRSPGAWAEFALAPRARIYPAPPGIADAIASQFALNPLTAWGLLAECDLQKSSRLLLTAGRSIVARLLAGLAHRRGLDATLLVRDGSGYSALAGDTGLPISRQDSVAEVLQELVGRNGPFHAVLDAVGGADTTALIGALEPGGRLISYGILDDGEVTLKASHILFKNMCWQGFGIDGWLNKATGEQLAGAQRELWQMMISEGPELLPVLGSFSLSRIQAALHAVRTRHRPGKVILTD